MTDIVIRPSRPGDGEARAELWQELGALFTSMNPHTFRAPATEGLAEWHEEIGAAYRDDENKLSLVAETDGALVGFIGAALHEPIDTAGRELQTDFSRRTLHINSLAVTATHRRAGIGSALMQAAEEWGRERGAEVVILETETNNPMSVPFYEQRMGFTAEAFIFRKEIAPALKPAPPYSPASNSPARTAPANPDAERE